MKRHHLVTALQSTMEQENVTPYQLSALSGISRHTIKGWFKDNHDPTVVKLELAFRALGYQLTVERIGEAWHCSSSRLSEMPDFPST